VAGSPAFPPLGGRGVLNKQTGPFPLPNFENCKRIRSTSEIGRQNDFGENKTRVRTEKKNQSRQTSAERATWGKRRAPSQNCVYQDVPGRTRVFSRSPRPKKRRNRLISFKTCYKVCRDCTESWWKNGPNKSLVSPVNFLRQFKTRSRGTKFWGATFFAAGGKKRIMRWLGPRRQARKG